MLWVQKACTKWLNFRYENSHYFHVSTIVHRKGSNEEALKNENGEQIFDKEVLRKMVVDFYSKLFSEQEMTCNVFPLWSFFPQLTPKDMSIIH